ncbi:hypothetical protein [Clostridium sp.]
MTKGYSPLTTSDYYYYNDSPAGGINATSDIAKFMIAHLQNGEYNGKIY